MIIKIFDPKEIRKISAVIHDEKFDKNDILFSAEKASLDLKFKRSKIEEKILLKKFLFMEKLSFPIVESFLKINYVESYKIKDKANIGTYDFNEITYDESKKKIIITSCVPLVIEILVKEFHISVEDSDKILDQKVVWSFSGNIGEGVRELRDVVSYSN